MTQKKLFSIAGLLVLLALIGIAFWQSEQRKSEALKQSLPPAGLYYAEVSQSGYLECRLMTSRISSTPITINEAVVALRSTVCLYTNQAGDMEFVMVPLAFYNAQTEQFYALTTRIDPIGRPSDGYIDGLWKALTNDALDPMVQLYAHSDFEKDPNFQTFWGNYLKNKWYTTWDTDFVRTGDQTYLPTAESGKKFFFATSFSHVEK